ncbi:MAG: hypothetical protein A2340_08045 [Lentisphaerae bacterium RIFOXYB12_FULL_60_10]|nr:MAG: hypothetical protein A2340_08045 [Lentisphaerae bacterium RIFOXYB12_FULL_60_10]
MQTGVVHLYVHVPFCDGACRYCAFYSERFDAAPADRYLDALTHEFHEAGNRGLLPKVPRTLYIGGGTPSVLDIHQLDRLCRLFTDRFHITRETEWTVETNPGSLTRDKAVLLQQAGVNRVSLGVQSFSDPVLRQLGRRHTVRQVYDSIADIRAAGIPSLNLDLIAAVPGIDAAAWRRHLDHAIALVPDHLSVYDLTVEPGTPLARAAHTGKWQAATVDTELRRIHTAALRLAGAGYHRYEISNYARPGQRCRHNLAFWQGGDYLGFGPAAASRVGLDRWTNRPSVKSYCTPWKSDLPPRRFETLSTETDASERLAFAFRLLDGITLRPFLDRAPGHRARWMKALNTLRKDGLVSRQGPRWKLTDAGIRLADTVASALL